MIIYRVDSKFLAVERGFGVNVWITRPEAALAGILSAPGNQFDGDGVLRAPRVFNDYETRGGEFLIIPIDDPGLHRVLYCGRGFSGNLYC